MLVPHGPLAIVRAASSKHESHGLDDGSYRRALDANLPVVVRSAAQQPQKAAPARNDGQRRRAAAAGERHSCSTNPLLAPQPAGADRPEEPAAAKRPAQPSALAVAAAKRSLDAPKNGASGGGEATTGGASPKKEAASGRRPTSRADRPQRACAGASRGRGRPPHS